MKVSILFLYKGFYPEENKSGLFYSKNAYFLKIKSV